MSYFDCTNGAGEIWSTGIFSFESPLKDLLDTGSYTLEDLLSEDELLQELRGVHPTLVKFLGTNENVAGLVRYLIRTPPNSVAPHNDFGNNRRDGGGDGTTAEQDPALTCATLDNTSRVAAGNTCGYTTDEATGPGEAAEDGDQANFLNTESGRDPSLAAPPPLITPNHDDANNGETVHEQASPNHHVSRPPGDWLFGQHRSEGRTQTCQTSHHATAAAAALMAEQEELKYIRYPYMACEVICCNISSIIDILVNGHIFVDHDNNSEGDGLCSTLNKPPTRPLSLLDLLFTILTDTPPAQLDDRRAGYLEKILSVLFRCRPVAMSNYMNGVSAASSSSANKICNGQSSSSVVTYHRGGGIPLMHAFFRHLHSHSIMQILQQLLLPLPPSVAKAHSIRPKSNSSSAESNSSNDWDSLLGLNNNNSNSIHGAAPPLSSEEEEEDQGDLDMCLPGGGATSGLLRCDWISTHPDEAIDLLLTRLTGDERTTTPCCSITATVSNTDHRNDRTLEEETIADSSRHASEILITMIRNSRLDSPIMRALTSDFLIKKIVLDGVCTLPPNGLLLMHESTMTTSMSVLESLILQLGGYGAVGTEGGRNGDGNDGPTSVVGNVGTLILPEVGDLSLSHMEEATDHLQSGGDETPSSSLPSPKPSNVANADPADTGSATIDTLVHHLPTLLQTLSSFLTHPSTSSWECPVQFSNSPRKLLGMSRLKTVRLLESLVLLDSPVVDHILCQSDCLELCLDLFWLFPWCSMLHQSVANLLVHVLEGSQARCELQKYFLLQCDLPRRLIDSFHGIGDIPAIDGVGNDDSSVTAACAANERTASSAQQKQVSRNAETTVSSIGESVTGPRYAEVVVALRNYRLGLSPSSTDTERGSEEADSDGDDDDLGDEEEEDEVLPISDDDVDAAMEQQEQLENNVDMAAADVSDENVQENDNLTYEVEKHTKDGEESLLSSITAKVRLQKMPLESAESSELLDAAAEAQSSLLKMSPIPSPPLKASFRTGYMGHVIIICQALVHASSVDQGEHQDVHTETPDLNGQDDPIDDNQAEGEGTRKRKDPPTSTYDDEDNSPNRKSLDANSKTNDGEGATSSLTLQSMKRNGSTTTGTGIMRILQSHPLYAQWQSFVTTTLASEIAVQSTPLGGYGGLNLHESSSSLHAPRAFLMDSGEFLDVDSPGIGSGFIVGGDSGIDLEDADLNVAASMMEALSLPATSHCRLDDYDTGSAGHNRRRGVMDGNMNGAAFGTVLQMDCKTGEYVYDDPLGGRQSFTNNDRDEEENDDPYCIATARASEDDGEDNNNNNNNNNNDGNDNDHGRDGDVPVLDLFAGNFTFEDSTEHDHTENFNATNAPPPPAGDSAWSNFANFNDAFAAASHESNPVVGSTIDFDPDFDNDVTTTDLFASANAADIIDASPDFVIGDSASIIDDEEDLFDNESDDGLNIVKSFAADEDDEEIEQTANGPREDKINLENETLPCMDEGSAVLTDPLTSTDKS